VPARPRPAPATETAPKQTVVLPNYVVPLVAAVLVIVAIIALPKILSRRPDSSSSTASASASPASQPKPAPPSARAETHPNAKSVQPSSPKTTPGKKPSEKSGAPASAAPAALRTDTFPSANASNSSGVSPSRGEVLDQILPDVSEKARGTIHGRVRVTVRANVDAAGNVSNAELDSRGPSQYFAELALKAVRRWEFTSPESGGRSVPSVWLIRFEFSQSSTQVFPKQIAP
jgi:TonB family protein